MIEVKADALEASFEALEREDDEVAALKARAVERPALSGVKSEGSPFVERYLRKGLEAGVELKAFSGASDAAGGYAVPEELDQRIEFLCAASSRRRARENGARDSTIARGCWLQTRAKEAGFPLSRE